MRGFERVGDLPGKGQRLVDRNGPSRNPLVETLTVDKLKDEELRTVTFFEPIDLRDVRMIQRGQNLGFAAEPGDTVGIVRERSRQDLQGDVTTQLRVLRTVDLTL
jgi:hypothetical protein